LVHTCSYEWVLKKKHNFCFKHEPKCNDGGCAPTGGIYPTGQGGAAPSGQYGGASGQIYGAGQHAFQAAKPGTSIASAPAEMTPALVGGEEAPPAPEVSTTRGSSLLLPPSGN
jgi:hypothetical protein